MEQRSREDLEAIASAAKHYLEAKLDTWETGYTIAMENEWTWLMHLSRLVGVEMSEHDSE